MFLLKIFTLYHYHSINGSVSHQVHNARILSVGTITFFFNMAEIILLNYILSQYFFYQLPLLLTVLLHIDLFPSIPNW